MARRRGVDMTALLRRPLVGFIFGAVIAAPLTLWAASGWYGVSPTGYTIPVADGTSQPMLDIGVKSGSHPTDTGTFDKTGFSLTEPGTCSTLTLEVEASSTVSNTSGSSQEYKVVIEDEGAIDWNGCATPGVGAAPTDKTVTISTGGTSGDVIISNAATALVADTGYNGGTDKTITIKLEAIPG